MVTRTPTEIPWRNWSEVQHYVNHAWDPQNSPHHALIGLTGSGKTYLGINGILGSMCVNDKVCILDTKHDDPLLMSVGKPVQQLPKFISAPLWRDPKPREFWYRLVVSDDRTTGRQQIASALSRIYREGDWVLYVDEVYDITHQRPPFYNLGPQLEEIWRKGRSRRVSVIGATQSPAWVPRSMYDQASFAWIGRIRDEQRQKRLLEIGGLTKADLTAVAELQRRQWLLSADNGEYFARTKVD